MKPVHFGVDTVCANPSRWKSGNLGLVTNDAARTATNSTLASRAALLQAGVPVVRLFSPEHGLQATAADGAKVPDTRDPLTGLPVTSLYGAKLRPLTEDFAGLDGILFDLPDIGSRFYTYIWTLHETLETCATTGTRLILLDRPNPLGGERHTVEGPILDVAHCSSFLGRDALPIRHSVTAGELLTLWNAERKLQAPVEVVPCEGWKRAMLWPDLHLEFIPTSPAMRTYVSALLYPGLCLFEASNLSVGRGTAFPFQMVGAPWLDASSIAAAFNQLNLPGIHAVQDTFCPSQEPWVGQPCHAVHLRLSDGRALRPVHAGLCLLALILHAHPENYKWADYPTAANPSGHNHFERLVGQPGLRDELQQISNIVESANRWTQAPGWWDRVRPHLLYPQDP